MVKKKRKVREHTEASNQTDENKPASFDSVDVLDEDCNNNEVKQTENDLPTISISELGDEEEHEEKISVLTYRTKSKSIVSTEHTVEAETNSEDLTVNSSNQVETNKIEPQTNNNNNTIKTICSWINSLIDLIPIPAHICRVSIVTTVSILIVFNIEFFSFGWF